MTHFSTEILQAEAPADVLRSELRDIPRFLSLCLQCPGHNASWLCPPVEAALSARIDAASKAIIAGIKITPSSLCTLTGQQIMQQARIPLEQHLLQLEAEHGGLACGLSGRCTYCDEPCARISAQPCRHPQLARPSLEAHGFNVSAIAERYLGLPILWQKDGRHPDYYILVGAVFFG